MATNSIIELSPHVRILTTDAEQGAIDSVKTLMVHPAFAQSTIVVQPDVHPGAGCVIGLTATFNPEYVVPNIIGVDIGCGVLAYNLGPVRDIDYQNFHRFIEEHVPSGFAHNAVVDDLLLAGVYQSLRDEDGSTLPTYGEFIASVVDSATVVGNSNPLLSIGTLGGGNHFIELAKDDSNNDVYLIIHSGSRNYGLCVATHFQRLAQHRLFPAKKTNKKVRAKQASFDDVELYAAEIRQLAQGVHKDVAFLAGMDVADYIAHMKLAQIYARLNRRVMGYKMIKHLGLRYKKCAVFESVHNYIDFNDNIIRKGAISARLGERVIIPLNMADGTIIGVGKGNDWTNQSAPHGAGRRLSRMKAKRELDVATFHHLMANVWSRCVNRGTIDESPEAYKPAESIIERLADSVEITARLKPIFNFKSGMDVI